MHRSDTMHLFLLGLFGGHGKGWAQLGLGAGSETLGSASAVARRPQRAPRRQRQGSGGVSAAQTQRPRSLHPGGISGVGGLRRNLGLTVGLMGSSDQLELYQAYLRNRRWYLFIYSIYVIYTYTSIYSLLDFLLFEDGYYEGPSPRSSLNKFLPE